MARLARDPDSLAELVRDGRPRRALVRGHVLAMLPRGARAMVLPYGIEGRVRQPGEAEPVLARIDVEEAPPVFERPMLERLERGRDFYLADGSGRALVRLEGSDFELHVDGEPRTLELGRGEAGERTAWVRVVRVGDEVIVSGRVTIEEDASGLGSAGFRESPRMVVFRGDPKSSDPVHLYDRPAFIQALAWDRLSWLGKLAVLLRSPSR
jgi:hypothetical protein